MKVIVFIVFLITALFQARVEAQTIVVKVHKKSVVAPITPAILDKSINLLNVVFNSPEFKGELEKYVFACSNKPDFCKEEVISGQSVFNDFIKNDTFSIEVAVQKLKNPWKRFISGTMGETDPNGYLIRTYPWWLDDESEKETIVSYATHLGHELFHTNYFRYIHNPEYGSKKFINDKDVTYKIDDILEALIRKNYY